MHLSRRMSLRAGVGLACLAGGCAGARIGLHDVLTVMQGQLEDGEGRGVPVETLLSAAAEKNVTVSFAYVGCGGGRPRIRAIDAIAHRAAFVPALNLVFDAIDDHTRHPEVERDILGDASQSVADSVRVVFVKKDRLWARQNNGAVCAMLQTMHARFTERSYLQSINEVGLFDPQGRFKGLYW